MNAIAFAVKMSHTSAGDETSASNDDGARAVAQIVKLHGDTSAAAGGVSL